MAEVTKEPGCEQFEVFQSVVNSDKLAQFWNAGQIRKLWTRTCA
jgi:hypothetical protein